MFNLLVGPLTSLIGDSVKAFVSTKKAKADLALTEIKAQKSLKEQRWENIVGSFRCRSNERELERRGNFTSPVNSSGASIYSWMDTTYQGRI